MRVGIIIGRFQAPYLHEGHIALIAEALAKEEKVVVLLGCTNNKDERNPYDIKHRVNIIQDKFKDVEVHPLWDHPSDEVWSKRVDLLSHCYGTTPTLYHSRDSFVSHYKGSIPTYEVQELPDISGTKLRALHNASEH